MSTLKIGIIREGKIPADRRTPLNPQQARQVMERFPQTEVYVQTSPLRCFSDQDYRDQGIVVREDVSDCQVLLGVKEVPVEQLLENKTYMFFSHTIKKQPYNRDLLCTILDKNIRLIDYECLTNPEGKRLIAFGRYAGIVGAYNGVLTYGLREELFKLRRAKDCHDLEELWQECKKVKLPPLKIALTGGGRVARGAMETLDMMNIRKVKPEEFLEESFPEAVYTQLRSKDYHERKSGEKFNLREFYDFPYLYKSTFEKYASATELLITANYWNPGAPALFSEQDMCSADFRIKVIADITCDIDGSIPSTKKASTIDDPFYDYNPDRDSIEPPFSNEENLTVMAIDNLPCELPRDASTDFGQQMLDTILPGLLHAGDLRIIEKGTIAKHGVLMPRFEYLQDYVEGKEERLA